MQIITISGVDGSGKSTQAQRLIDDYEQRGKKVYYLHAVAFSVAQQLLKPSAGTATCHSGSSASLRKQNADTGLSRTRASWLAVLLRKVALAIDLVRFRFLVRRLARQGYDVLISDRFFFDTVVNIRYLARTERVGVLERLVPRVDYALFFAIEPDAIMQRSRAPEQGGDYLRAKTALFAARKDVWQMHTVNADQTPDAVFAEVLRVLEHPHNS